MALWIDADACPKPLREIICRAAIRTQQETYFVANHFINLQTHPCLRSIQVAQGFDVADNYIAQHAVEFDCVVTSDIVLADILLDQFEAITVINYLGDKFTRANIKQKLAMRDLMQSLRDDYQVQGKRNPSFSAAQSKAFADQLNRYLSQF